MKKYIICKETAVLREHQRIRAERVLHKRVDQWDGGDILNIVFDGEIQNRIDWMPEKIDEYGTLEEAQDAAATQVYCDYIWNEPVFDRVLYQRAQ